MAALVLCQYILSRGPRKGQPCNKSINTINIPYCKKHKHYHRIDYRENHERGISAPHPKNRNKHSHRTVLRENEYQEEEKEEPQLIIDLEVIFKYGYLPITYNVDEKNQLVLFYRKEDFTSLIYDDKQISSFYDFRETTNRIIIKPKRVLINEEIYYLNFKFNKDSNIVLLDLSNFIKKRTNPNIIVKGMENAHSNDMDNKYCNKNSSCHMCQKNIEENTPIVFLGCKCKYHLNCYLLVQNEDKCMNCNDKIFKTDDDYHECSICLEPIKKDKVKTYCNHRFHKKCLNSWKKISKSCPMCRELL